MMSIETVSRLVPVLVLVLLSFVISSINVNAEDTKPEEDYMRNDAFVRDYEHLQEHLGEYKIDLEKASDEEKDFMYFKLHDMNNDDKLDGLEILASINHQREHSLDKSNRENATKTENENNEQEFNMFVGIIDLILNNDDLDNDGYLSYPEYAKARVAVSALKYAKMDEINIPGLPRL